MIDAGLLTVLILGLVWSMRTVWDHYQRKRRSREELRRHINERSEDLYGQ